MYHRKTFITAYIFLVGVPLLALVGVLEAGRKLVAPPAVDGPWVVDADFRSLAPSPCGALFGTLRQPVLLISQSGTHFDFALNAATRLSGEGALQGPDLTASGGVTACSVPQNFLVTASVSGQPAARVLNGKISLPSCADCAPVAFHAIHPIAPRNSRTK